MERFFTGNNSQHITSHLLWWSKGQITLHLLHAALLCI